MKLRIMGDSLRVRLSQSEVAKLGKGETVDDTTRFPGNVSLTYEIRSSASDDWGCIFVNSSISLFVPKSILEEWAKTELVGVKGELDLEKNSKLSILIEKDFKCLTKRLKEDDSDLYPNPVKSH